MTDLLALARADEDWLLGSLGTLVRLESPSSSKHLVNELGRVVSEHLDGCGIQSHTEPRSSVGDIVWGEWSGSSPQGRILVLCHLDTVHPAGSLDRNPVRLEDGRLYGPGTCDMKASIVATMFAQRCLHYAVIRPSKAVRFLYTTDEEIGSFQSRGIIEAFARESDVALVLEPPLPGGALKLSRKGSGVFKIRVRGRASHAGAAPEQGINAIAELCRQVGGIADLANPDLGTTVSVTMIKGGTAENVIPEIAEATVDVRFLTQAEGLRAEQGLRNLSPLTAGAEIEIEGELDRPPMEQSPEAVELFERVRLIAAEMGVQLQGGPAGGGSDGSFTAAQGIPTLDGLGAEGGGGHSPDEYIEIESLITRSALLALVLERL